LEPVEQWFWVRDGLFGTWEYNPDALSGRKRGLPIDPASFVVFESVPLNRILALAYLRKSLNERDWDSYLEVFGIPSTFLVGPPNTPAAKEAEYQAIAEAIISDGRGYLPNGSDVKHVNAYGAKPPFLDRIEYLDRQITLAGTGGLLTMLAEPGSGTLAGNAHADTFLQIARSDAAILSGIFQEQFDTPLLREFFPDQPILAYFEFAPPAADEVSRVVRDAVELAKAGVRIDLNELSEKTGYRLEQMADPPPRKASASAKATADMPA
jgi:phage gp29-like protein